MRCAASVRRNVGAILLCIAANTNVGARSVLAAAVSVAVAAAGIATTGRTDVRMDGRWRYFLRRLHVKHVGDTRAVRHLADGDDLIRGFVRKDERRSFRRGVS